jgi:predicted Zn-dependent protease with MMP-like domain
MEIDEAAFEEYVAEALDGVPPELAGLMDNVVVLVEAEPPSEDPHLLGLYHGTPLTERDSGYTFREPDRILIYRGPLTRMCSSAEELVEEVRITVVHEIAHHFGIDDAALHDLGYA